MWEGRLIELYQGAGWGKEWRSSTQTLTNGRRSPESGRRCQYDGDGLAWPQLAVVRLLHPDSDTLTLQYKLKKIKQWLCVHYRCGSFSVVVLFSSQAPIAFTHVIRLFTAFLYQDIQPWGWFTLIHTWCLICGHQCRSDISRIKQGFRGVGLQGAGYDVGSNFAGGGIRAAGVTLAFFGLTEDSTETEQAELITIILSVAATMHHIFRCIHNIQSINRWMIGAWVRD